MDNNIWVDILITESGVEFSDWLLKAHEIKYNKKICKFEKRVLLTDSFTDLDCYMVNGIVKKYLDAKGVYLDEYYERGNEDGEEFCYRISTYCFYEDSSNNGIYYDDRQTAIEDGIKRVFALMKNFR